MCIRMKASQLAMLSMVLATAGASTARAELEAPTSPAGVAGKVMNPDISVDSLFSMSQFNRDQPIVFDGGHDPHQSGFNLQQVELTYGANIDPYFRGDANLVLTPQGIEIEEAYATTLDLPGNFQIKGGQFLTAFGRINQTHPHSWDYVDEPLVMGRMFGGDLLRNPGAQVSWLSPLPWYSELVVSGQNSNGTTVPSFRPDPATMRSVVDYLMLVRSNNFVSFSDLLSMNFGASFAEGPNTQGPTTRTQIGGADFYVKYRRPESLSYIALQTEILRRYYQAGDGTDTDWGWYAQVDCRLDAPYERWHVGTRLDLVSPNTTPVQTLMGGMSGIDNSWRYRVSPVVTFYPTEFSKLRLQYDYDKPAVLASAQQVVSLQLEFLMGAHGAHKF